MLQSRTLSAIQYPRRGHRMMRRQLACGWSPPRYPRPNFIPRPKPQIPASRATPEAVPGPAAPACANEECESTVAHYFRVASGSRRQRLKRIHAAARREPSARRVSWVRQRRSKRQRSWAEVSLVQRGLLRRLPKRGSRIRRLFVVVGHVWQND